MGSDLAATRYRTTTVKGLNIFYREAGDPRDPALVLLHGFPSSSVMFRDLMTRLADRLYLIAPDYPGFGRSDAPPPNVFRYSFDHLTEIVDAFLEQQRIARYSLYLQDYGGPIGFRLALAHPERVQALVIQNAVAKEQGLSELWVPRRAFWADRAAHEAAVRANLLSLEATRQRHVGRSPHPERIDPETWEAEYALLSRPGMVDIQLDLFHDYGTNVASYPKWRAYLRDVRPRTLVGQARSVLHGRRSCRLWRGRTGSRGASAGRRTLRARRGHAADRGPHPPLLRRARIRSATISGVIVPGRRPGA